MKSCHTKPSRLMSYPAIALSFALASSVALAADESVSAETQTDIVGSKEAPSVFNIVPWKEKQLETSQRSVNTSILRETLQPLDREVLRREVQLQMSLSKK